MSQLLTMAWSRLPKLTTWKGTVLCRKIKSMKVEGNENLWLLLSLSPILQFFSYKIHLEGLGTRKKELTWGQPERRGMKKECSMKQQMTAENNNQEWKWFGLDFVPLKICMLKPRPPVWLYLEIKPLSFRLSEIIKIEL